MKKRTHDNIDDREERREIDDSIVFLITILYDGRIATRYIYDFGIENYFFASYDA